MFQEACKTLLYGHAVVPIEIATHLKSGKTGYGVGAGILVNDDGWILTAGHILKTITDLNDAADKARSYEKRVKDIHDDGTLSDAEKNAKLDSLGEISADSSIRRSAIMIAYRDTRKIEGTMFEPADVGVFRAKDFPVPEEYRQPRFRKEPIYLGEMFCRAGYPFYEKMVEWDEEHQTFVSRAETVPLFVNEGLVSRFLKHEVTLGGDKKAIVNLMETSSPGLRGQSGGPLFDTMGRILGMQIQTTCYPLDFKGEKDGHTEHQFLNVGRALHVETILRFLDSLKISYRIE